MEANENASESPCIIDHFTVKSLVPVRRGLAPPVSRTRCQSRFTDSAGSEFADTVAGTDAVAPPHGCVEAGTVYAEGSPLASSTECERCFCLGGRRRCVRPRCLTPPAGCGAAPAAGACCPQRYYCQHHNASALSSTTESSNRSGECTVKGKRVAEGELVPGEPCVHCYCLHGAVLCQPAACAQTLLDCQPLLQPGHCCPHRYRCPPRLHTSLPAPTGRSRALDAFDPATAPISSTLNLTMTLDDPREHVSTHNDSTSTNGDSTETAVDETIQPDGSIRVVVNGSVDCTAELADAGDDIITEAAFLDRDSFVVNVTSSLRTNSSRPAAPPAPAARPPAPPPASAHNEYDYDYNEATLPPSLPNLKIIPFVAADAVVQREERPASSVADRRRGDPSPAYAPLPAPPSADHRRDDTLPAYVPPPAPPSAEHRRDDALPAYAPLPPPAARPSSPTRPTTATPPIGLFSPPAHIEGGFVPKGASFDSDEPAPSAAPAPAPPTTLFTQNPIGSGTCTTADGETVKNGASVSVMCDECACARGRLRCARRPCRTPPACHRSPLETTLALRDASLDTYCCGELVCNHERNITTTESSVEKGTEQTTNFPPQTNASELVTAKFAQISTVSTTPRSAAGAPTAAAATAASTTLDRNATAAPSRPPASARPAQDYAEEEDDEGFSFGNVLQLLLSDSYGTTSATTTTRAPGTSRATLAASSSVSPTTARTTVAEPSIAISNRIDHLLLGESTSIRRTTPRSTTARAPPAPAPDAAVSGGGLLSKLAGCNIYGRMYRVGRIIAELSSACAECRCTELGVQCRALRC
ncbi:Extracellular matrix protein FRAS1 [Eumeta japonica]|uniref:Extracellular matrix protein FRAS1 n=1 Tax=Eumeta variegata TaxID=151549 RepID=A0A4C1V0K2_EUMVA|nr:Extracellular matrix protein FRAS1 [Eumeta japonica]